MLLLVLLATAALVASPAAHADEAVGLEVDAALLAAEFPAATPPCVSRTLASDGDTPAAPPRHRDAERREAAHGSAADAIHDYDDPAHLVSTSAPHIEYRSAPQTPDDCDGDTWVIGESWEGRTQWAARAFKARAWDGPPRGSSHLQTCAANESWLRGIMARGDKIIDIGIDRSRQGNRSPYYELEQRIITETGYPVEERFWFSSARPYPGVRIGACP